MGRRGAQADHQGHTEMHRRRPREDVPQVIQRVPARPERTRDQRRDRDPKGVLDSLALVKDEKPVLSVEENVMAATVRIPTVLRPAMGGLTTVTVEGSTIGAVLTELRSDGSPVAARGFCQ